MIELHEEVREAQADGRPVVALESTIFSHLGLPEPHNREALRRCLAAARDDGAVPAVTAVVDGVPRVGLTDAQQDRMLAADRKCGARDLPVAVAQRWGFGATTVSASLTLAAAAGLEVFATGGIGGVHRDAPETGDVSADLGAIAGLPVVTVTAGAKSFLDLARTLEHLETAGVPVLGWRTDDFPAFYVRSSGLAVQTRVESAGEVADVVRATRALGHGGGVIVAVPVPEGHALDAALVDRAIEEALAAADDAGVTGKDVTPFVLEHITATTGGASLDANLALAEHNARVAAELAGALLAAG